MWDLIPHDIFLLKKFCRYKMSKEIKILSLNNIDRRQADLIEDFTQEIHYWKRNVSEDDIKDFMDRMRLPDAKYAFTSMILAGDYSFLNPSDNDPSKHR